jgi:TetR/AcrR family transcriptional regulator, regulator of biofilm formation and stress response
MTSVTRPGEIRQRIILAVLAIIAEDGVAAVTNRRIAREASVSLGSVTYHFPSQHDLLRESLRYFVGEETRRLTELAEARQHGEPSLDQARALVAQVAGVTGERESIAPFELFIQAGRDPRLRTAAAECFAAFDRVAAKILAALGMPEAAAGAAVAMVVGLQLRRLSTGSDTEDMIDALVLLTSIGVTRTGRSPVT